ncbi:MAG TPA: FtsX-like permease family protein [Burkholderiaceae bacterium]|nr:FtsX-like permease family protein [Burkholderiaceae bacterium]
MIVFTNSFTAGISTNMASSVTNQIDGHLRIQHKDFKRYFIADQERILLNGWRDVAADIGKLPHVKAVMPRLLIGGLAGKDDRTSTFFGSASELSLLDTVLPDYAIHLVDGKPLSPDDPDGVLLGESMARDLRVKVGDELVLLSKTVSGDQSSTLVHVRGITQYPSDHVAEQSLILTGLGTAVREQLLDLGDGTGQLVVRLDDPGKLPATIAAIDDMLAKRGLPWQVVPWYENALYARMVALFGGIGALVTAVLAVMVAVITSNSLLMAFFERIREIGTLRAVGMTRLNVGVLLYLESALLGCVGTGAGLLIGVVATLVLGRAGIPVGLLGQDVRPAVQPMALAVSVLVPMACIAMAAALPIRSATRMSVIEAINHQ